MIRFFRCRKFCRFIAEGVKETDYEGLNALKVHAFEAGKIVPNRITDTKAKHQRQLAIVTKHTRYPALLPYTNSRGY